jgi:hypothetical protein
VQLKALMLDGRLVVLPPDGNDDRNSQLDWLRGIRAPFLCLRLAGPLVLLHSPGEG